MAPRAAGIFWNQSGIDLGQRRDCLLVGGHAVDCSAPERAGEIAVRAPGNRIKRPSSSYLSIFVGVVAVEGDELAVIADGRRSAGSTAARLIFPLGRDLPFSSKIWMRTVSRSFDEVRAASRRRPRPPCTCSLL